MIDGMLDLHTTTTGAPPQPESGGGPSGWLKNLAIPGALRTISGFGASQPLRQGFTLVRTHLLFPELSFGLAIHGLF